MKVEYHIIRDYSLQIDETMSDEEIAQLKRNDPEFRRSRFSLTSLCDGENGKLYVGATNFAGDVLVEFDLATDKFRSLGYDKMAEPQDHKIHRGLWLDKERNSLYFGMATLSPLADTMTAKGGRIWRYDIGEEAFHEIGRPCQGSWIQAIGYDPQRQLVYSFTEPALGFGVTEIATGKTRRHGTVESIVHIPAIDPDGNVWGTWGRTHHAFFSYNPDTDKFTFHSKCKFPNARAASGLMYAGSGPVDEMIAGPDGTIYTASAMGEIYRLDWKNAKLEYICRPVPHERLPGLTFGPDGRLYGAGGDRWDTVLFACDVNTGAVEQLGRVVAEDETACFRPHDLKFIDGRFFICETDNPQRSGYLWSVRL